MPPATTKKRHPLEPISYDELLSNAGMSGFVSFLEAGARSEAASGAVSGAATAVAPVVAYAPSADGPHPLKWSRNGRQSRIWKATMVEDGHSLAEQAVYEALWNAASPVGEPDSADRTIRIGYHRLAQLTRLSWVSAKANLRSLERKLAIEVTGCENSAAQQGKRYRVYSRPAILERRKLAGLEWVRRTRGVELLSEASFYVAGGVHAQKAPGGA